ncbi:hypothetical protein TCDM_09348 [Trypanosoma cruzi Dm28c]|uniref:Uncharacterized protein n=1 Tax=Trypanosoma cruzi Dm28c TaxID=1416333 RepID=V5B5M9_TRYCR|nr:hypothetical protein TCDM_09348 [Trypanosoma cruzi Dm28c]
MCGGFTVVPPSLSLSLLHFFLFFSLCFALLCFVLHISCGEGRRHTLASYKKRVAGALRRAEGGEVCVYKK